jgi:hypothetical protein
LTGHLQVQPEGDAALKKDGAKDEEMDPGAGSVIGSAIQPVGLEVEKPVFGDVVTKEIEDGAEIRKKFARG